ncbi:MAG TPA: ATP-binding protein [Vicinamibacterales bacterium]|nr:ATP-binding protein [Vicinamibacterales bacterium]
MSDAEERTKIDVCQELLQALERLKLQGLSGAASDQAIMLVALAKGNRLELPWDADPSAARFRESVEEPDFAVRILQAKRAERTQKRYDQAAILYRESIAHARSESQRVYARFLLAEALARSGRDAEAIRIHRDLLKLPSTTVDEYGVPFAYYVALRMMSDHRMDRDVLDRVAIDLRSPASLPAHGIYVLRDILEAARHSGDVAVAQRAQRALDVLSAREKYLEQVSTLQKDFPSLRLTSTDWQAYRRSGSSAGDTWMISLTPSAADSARLIAVRATDIFKSIESSHRARADGPHFDIGGAGQPLGEGLPGLRITFRRYVPTGISTILVSERPIYILSLFCMVVMTFVGGYLLWRDTQREMYLADVRNHFVSSVSHELKTPLTAIRMFAEIMQMQGPGDAAKQKEHLETIVNETERLTRLLNNVLDFSRLERGDTSYNMQPAALSEVVYASARAMRFSLAERRFDLRIHVDEEIPQVQVDRDAIEQAILNLLTNAMKYSGASRDIELRLLAQNGSAVIQVSDHGIGIPLQEQPRIFEKFYRVPTPENCAIPGAGLGLALVAHIAEAHRGAVEVDSSPGKGSTFTIRLPIDAGSRS